jgi:hypothetical protein
MAERDSTLQETTFCYHIISGRLTDCEATAAVEDITDKQFGLLLFKFSFTGSRWGHFCLRPDSEAVAEGLGRHI